MINGKSVIAIIPARGGSKGLPGKNIRSLCGKPLLAWSIEAAKAAKHVDVVTVSTDDPQIAAVAAEYGAPVPFLRPAELASDTASSYDVIRHVLDFHRTQSGREFDYVMLLEPTSPLRQPDDVDRMLETLVPRAADYNAIVSIGEVGTHPAILKRFDGERIEPFVSGLRQTTRRQDNEPAYFPFGVAYIAERGALLAANTFYTDRCMGFPIQRHQCYEIDDIYDFVCVEAVMRHEQGPA